MQVRFNDERLYNIHIWIKRCLKRIPVPIVPIASIAPIHAAICVALLITRKERKRKSLKYINRFSSNIDFLFVTFTVRHSLWYSFPYREYLIYSWKTMAFTGDLEYLHIVDIIQLLHTTRKSGTFSVKGPKGESRIIFSNGYIVGANHLNNSIRIGTILVKTNIITPDDLKAAFEVQKKAGMNRKPLLATLIEMGTINHEKAAGGLKKLIEITLVEMMGWTQGTFTIDTDAIEVSPNCRYIPDKMEQEVSLDAQMVLMDTLRVFDERERDRNSGKQVPSYEELYMDVIPPENTVKTRGKGSLTADDLGLADLDHLEKKIPKSFSLEELFDPVEIHRQNLRETLDGFSDEEQEAFVSFLKKVTSDAHARKRKTIPEDNAKALLLFSRDKFIKHSVMTICKYDGILVFATEDEEELDSIITQCLAKRISPIMVFDSPEISERGFSKEQIVTLRQKIKERYPMVSTIQLTSPLDFTFPLQSYLDGVRAVFPRPAREHGKETFIENMIMFLETFTSYFNDVFLEEKELPATDARMRNLRDRVAAFRDLNEPPEISFALLQSVAGIFERSITFVVRPTELIGEKALGVNGDRTTGPTSAGKMKILLADHSVFRDVIETGKTFYGESEDTVLREEVFEKIGEPLSSVILLLPLKSHGKIMALTYGDFATKESSPVPIEMLEILAHQAGLVLENVLYRKHMKKVSQK